MDRTRVRTYLRWAMRGQRGQTAAETMGVLLLISGVVFMLATSDTPAKMADRTQEIVCGIGGGESCGDTAGGLVNGPMIPGDGDQGPDDGPAIGDGEPLLALPYPGFVSVTCTGDTRTAGNGSCVSK